MAQPTSNAEGSRRPDSSETGSCSAWKMNSLKPPAELRLTGNLEENWRRFKQRLDIYLKATGYALKPDDEKAALFLHVAGEEALEIYNTFEFAEDEEREAYDTLVQKFEQYCIPRKNETFERYVFRTRQQTEGEPFEQFLRDVKTKAQSCNFGAVMDSMIRDQIVYGILDKKLCARLLREVDLTLEKAGQICKAAEVAQHQNRTWEGNQKSATVDAMEKTKLRESTSSSKCARCNLKHATRSCPAYGKVCLRCGRKNHFAVRCPLKATSQDQRNWCVHQQQERSKEQDTNSTHQGRKQSAAALRALRNEEQQNVAPLNLGSDSSDDFDILDISVCSADTRRDWIITASVVQGTGSRTTVELKVDTGSQANLIPFSVFRKVGQTSSLRPSGSTLRNYDGGVIKHLGIATLRLRLHGMERSEIFFVVKNGRQAILGLQASEMFGLVTRVGSVGIERSVPQEFASVFSGTGCVSRRYHMVLQEHAQPSVQPARRVPLALREPLKNELQGMVKHGIIEKVDAPTD